MTQLNIELMATFEEIYKELQKSSFMQAKREKGYNIKTVGLCDLCQVFCDILYRKLIECYTTPEAAQNDFMIRLNIGNLRSSLPSHQENCMAFNIKNKDFLKSQYDFFIENFF